MKAMSKSELAQAAGVSVDTLMRWLSPHQQHLEAGPGCRCERRYADEMAKSSPATFGGTWHAPRHAGTAAKGGDLYRGNALHRRLTAVIPLKPA